MNLQHANSSCVLRVGSVALRMTLGLLCTCFILYILGIFLYSFWFQRQEHKHLCFFLRWLSPWGVFFVCVHMHHWNFLDLNAVFSRQTPLRVFLHSRHFSIAAQRYWGGIEGHFVRQDAKRTGIEWCWAGYETPCKSRMRHGPQEIVLEPGAYDKPATKAFLGNRDNNVSHSRSQKQSLQKPLWEQHALRHLCFQGKGKIWQVLSLLPVFWKENRTI